ncbi:diacylglycerol/lipid kinase family protein [Natrialbaceae archaeon GCM10025810]|uniref:diacylglycerol/lipid kinase family protein n=1 Tax=Halovalidus salilacus TaxID=3075124 RepID=UPI00361F45D7
MPDATRSRAGSEAESAAIDGSGKRLVVMNPTSGDGGHAEAVRRLADERGFSVVETERAGHAVDLARSAATDGVDLVAACGGDGTVHEVVRGLVDADALESVSLAVIPAGTANIYAEGLGIDTLEEGFAAAERGAVRRLDVGTAGDEPFVMSAIAGLPAEASEAATESQKARFGSFSFVLEGLRSTREFNGVEVAVEADADDGSYVWRGEALCLVIGVLRRFTGANEPSNAERGRLEVMIVDRVPPTDALADVVKRRFLDRAGENSCVTTIEARDLEIVALEDEPVRFSLDGEIRSYEALEIGIRPGALRVCVGEEYAGRSKS